MNWWFGRCLLKHTPVSSAMRAFLLYATYIHSTAVYQTQQIGLGACRARKLHENEQRWLAAGGFNLCPETLQGSWQGPVLCGNRFALVFCLLIAFLNPRPCIHIGSSVVHTHLSGDSL